MRPTGAIGATSGPISTLKIAGMVNATVCRALTGIATHPELAIFAIDFQ